jgi:hypothetical protein
MSWSIDVTGTKSAVVKKVTEQLDKIAASYEGKEEAKDVLAAKERILALVGAVDLEPAEEGKPPSPNAIQVKANGSHALTAKGIDGARMSINVTRTHLAID